MRSSAVRLLQRAGASVEAARFAAAAAPAVGCSWLHGASSVQASACMDGTNTAIAMAAGAWQSSAHLATRGLTTSTAAAAEAQAAVKVDGDLGSVLAAIDSAISSDTAGPKDIADAAMSLAYLQSRGDRRLWGKVLEKAAAHRSSFDAASLTALLWAANTANVTHFKTLYELSEPAMKLLGSFTPAQLAIIVEGLGGAGVNDPDFYRAVTDKVAGKAGDYSPAQLARILWGYAAAGIEDAKLAKAAAGGIVSGAGNAGAKELAQAAWALAKLRRGDKAALDGLSRALGGKLGNGDAPQDAVAAIWAFAQLGAKPDSGFASKAAGLIRGGAKQLTTVQAIHGAWGMAALGLSDKDTLAALLTEAGSAVAAAPEALPVPVLAMLWEASALATDAMGGQAPKLPDQVQSYVQNVYLLARDAAKVRRGPGAREFRADVAQATARALGARYKPEVDNTLKSLPKRTPDGLDIDIGVDLDKDVKVAVEPLDASELTSTAPNTPLGAAAVRRRLLDARGYKTAHIPYPEWAQLKDDKAKAAYVLNAIKGAAPGAGGKVSQLQKKLEEPFDPYQ